MSSLPNLVFIFTITPIFSAIPHHYFTTPTSQLFNLFCLTITQCSTAPLLYLPYITTSLPFYLTTTLLALPKDYLTFLTSPFSYLLDFATTLPALPHLCFTFPFTTSLLSLPHHILTCSTSPLHYLLYFTTILLSLPHHYFSCSTSPLIFLLYLPYPTTSLRPLPHHNLTFLAHHYFIFPISPLFTFPISTLLYLLYVTTTYTCPTSP